MKLADTFHYVEYRNIIEHVEKKSLRDMAKKRKCVKRKLKMLQHMKKVNTSTTIPKPTHVFFNRVYNMTNIQFNDKEEQLLSKGLKHNIKEVHKKQNTITLLNVENTITKAEIGHQDDMRTLFIDEFSRRIKQPATAKKQDLSEKIVKDIRKKLSENNAIITKADKGNTVVVISEKEYNDKIELYINENNIKKMNSDPTKTYLKSINSQINKSNSILNKGQMYYCKMIKPEAPTITGLPKIHKENTPLRPLINFTTSPTYKISKVINNWLSHHIKFKTDMSVKNNLELVEKIKMEYIPHNAKLASFDITNMYSNIPVKETLQITEDILKQNNIEKPKIMETIDILRTITQQNYFTHNNDIYTQTNGLPMGSPLSGTLANIFLNHMETKYIINNSNPHNHNIIYWHRYVDDILILFNGTNRQLGMLHQFINNIHNNIKFTLELETHKSINFLDLTIQNINHKHNFKIYRKQTQTNHTIHITSQHPFQHKIAAYNHMLNRLNNIPMDNDNYSEELNTIKHIAHANGYPEKLISVLNKKIKQKIHHRHMTTLNNDDKNVKKYLSNVYDQRTINVMSKICNRFGYTIAHRTNQTLLHKLKLNKKNEIDSGIYRLICNDCNSFYLGQTGRTFKQRFNEHTQEINKKTIATKFKSNYAQHMHNNQHTYTDMETNLQIIKRLNKCDMMNRIEEMEIYKERNNPLIMNDKLNTRTNKIYDYILHNHNTINT